MVHDEQAAALEQLAAAIPSKTYATTLTSGVDRQPRPASSTAASRAWPVRSTRIAAGTGGRGPSG